MVDSTDFTAGLSSTATTYAANGCVSEAIRNRSAICLQTEMSSILAVSKRLDWAYKEFESNTASILQISQLDKTPADSLVHLKSVLVPHPDLDSAELWLDGDHGSTDIIGFV